MKSSLNQHVAALTARLILGFVFLMQGYGKVFKWGISNLYNNGFKSYEAKLPEFLLWFTAYYTSFVELVGGFLLVIGLFKNYALYALAAVLVIVTFGHGLSTPIWDLSDVMFRGMLLIFLLSIPKEWDKFSIDNKLFR